MRRLIVLDERWDSALTYFGVEVAKLLKGERACAVLEGSPADRACRELDIERFFIKDPRKGFLSVPCSFLSLLEVLRSYRPETVITIRGDELLFSSLLKPLFGYRVVRVHGEEKGIRENIFNRLLHKRFVDLCILSSEKLRSGVIEGVKSVVINGVVDTERFRFSAEGRERLRGELGVGSSVLLGVIGRLDRVKGHDVFLKALSDLRRKGFDVRGLIVGEEKGVKALELKSLAEGLGVGDTIFITERRADIVDIISAIDVGVVPSRGSEMIARVLLEFMSVGLPVVASAVGVMDEIVDERFGYIFKPEDWKDLSSKVEELLRRNIKTMGAFAREVAVERYSEKSVSSIINAVIP